MSVKGAAAREVRSSVVTSSIASVDKDTVQLLEAACDALSVYDERRQHHCHRPQ